MGGIGPLLPWVDCLVCFPPSLCEAKKEEQKKRKRKKRKRSDQTS